MTAATTLARLLLAVTAAALVASGCGSGAPERPAAGGREGASLTEVRITLTDDGFELEGPVEAEPVRFVLRNGTDAPRVAFFAAVNEGVSRREVEAALKDGPQALLPLVTVAGSFPQMRPDATAQRTIEFPEGQYLLIDPQAQPPPVGFMEVGPATGPTPAPPSDYRIEAGEFYFEVPETVPAGGTAEIVNAGEQAHELSMFPTGPTAGTAQPFSAILPPPGGRMWTTIDLPPGDYELSCHFADPETGQHHADLGMVATTTVE